MSQDEVNAQVRFPPVNHMGIWSSHPLFLDADFDARWIRDNFGYVILINRAARADDCWSQSA
jgi:hypothetical protein